MNRRLPKTPALLLTVLRGGRDAAGNEWPQHGGDPIRAKHPNPGRAHALRGVLWGGSPSDLRGFPESAGRWVLWTASHADLIDREGDTIWARAGRVLVSGERGTSAEFATDEAMNFHYLLEEERATKDRHPRERAARILAAKGLDDLDRFDVLVALGWPDGEPSYFKGGVASTLTCPPFVRRGDLVEVDLLGRAEAVPGTMAVAAVDEGDADAPYPMVELRPVFEGPEGPMFGVRHRLSDVRLLGAVTRHRWRLDGSQTGTTEVTNRGYAVPFFYTHDSPFPTVWTRDPKGLRL